MRVVRNSRPWCQARPWAMASRSVAVPSTRTRCALNSELFDGHGPQAQACSADGALLLPRMLLQDLKKALRAAEVKQREGIYFSRGRAYFFLLECSKHKDLECGKVLRALMSNSKLDSIPVLADHLIRLFAACGSLDDANQMFEKVLTPSVHTWCAIIAAHAKLGQCDSSFELYDRMLSSGTHSNKCVYLAMLKASSIARALNQGKQIHHQVIKSGLQLDVTLGNSMIDMYAKCGSLDEACKVFHDLPCRNVVSWNAMFTGCINQGEMKLVVPFFGLMQAEGLKPNIVTWGALIEGYAEDGEGLLALDSFDKMQCDGIEPDRVIFLSILKACGSVGAINRGRLIHDQIVRVNIELDGVGNALIEMYSNCGSLGESQRVLDRLTNRDVVSWNTIIAAYAQYGHTKLALQSLQDMQLQGIKPDYVTFISILSSCSHAGLVEELQSYIKSMHEDYGILPDTKHYTCMLDLLGQLGHLNEASKLHRSVDPDIVSSISLLTACKRHGNMELGRFCFNQAVDWESNVTTHTLFERREEG